MRFGCGPRGYDGRGSRRSGTARTKHLSSARPVETVRRLRMAMDVSTQIIRSELAPLGRLRVAINLGNPVLAQRAADGALAGVSVDLAWEIAVRLGVEMELS